jgi:hypothetical protein
MRATLIASCASAASGAARRPPVTAERNARRFMAPFLASSAASRGAPGSPDPGLRVRPAPAGGSCIPPPGRSDIVAETLPQACVRVWAALWAHGSDAGRPRWAVERTRNATPTRTPPASVWVRVARESGESPGVAVSHRNGLGELLYRVLVDPHGRASRREALHEVSRARDAITVAHRTDRRPATSRTDPTDLTVRVSFAKLDPLVTKGWPSWGLVGTGLAGEGAPRRRRLAV